MIDHDDDDGLDDVADFDLKDELSHKMRTTGAVIAYRTAVAICKDPKATAAAKASAVNSLFRAGGFFAAQEPGAGAGKELHEMTADELRAASRKAQADLAALQRRAEADAEDPSGLFD
ncbi:hypothetical protein [Tardiphaga sp.]|jgi:hypothetical protein|uniref:hypothetical protein n=1 Tax=Tardiphaga sp. TaxID=1926292 RepID=UPI0037DA6DCB